MPSNFIVIDCWIKFNGHFCNLRNKCFNYLERGTVDGVKAVENTLHLKVWSFYNYVKQQQKCPEIRLICYNGVFPKWRHKIHGI